MKVLSHEPAGKAPFAAGTLKVKHQDRAWPGH